MEELSVHFVEKNGGHREDVNPQSIKVDGDIADLPGVKKINE